MTIDAWLQAAIADAERRGLPDLKPVLETLAKATTALRAADFNQSAVESRQSKGQGDDRRIVALFFNPMPA